MWATSMGSTLSHSPLPGVRKSGIPDGTEIPAPVRATTESATRMNSASCAAELCLLPAANRLLALPLRGPLAEEGGNALLCVLALERGRERGLLGLDPLVEVAGVRDPLDQLGRERGLAGELAGPGDRGVEQLVVGDDLVRQPVGLCLGGQDRVADQVHLQRLLRPDQPR